MDKLVSRINKLIVRISKGDEKALDELFLLTRRMLLLMAKKYLYDKSYAEDLVSETYYKIVKHSSTFDKNKNGLNWIYKIIHNEAINYNIKNQRLIEYELDENSNSTYYEDEILDKILVESAVQKLSPDEKHIIYLRYWEGLDLKEISERIGKPLSTTYDYLKRILKKLYKLMK